MAFKQKKSVIAGTKGHSMLKQTADQKSTEDLINEGFSPSDAKSMQDTGASTGNQGVSNTEKSDAIRNQTEYEDKQQRVVDPVTGGNNAEYEKKSGKLMQDMKDGKITKAEYDKKRKALISKLRNS